MAGVYGIDLVSGEMTSVGRLGGQNRGAVISRNGTWLASNYGHFGEWSELNVKKVKEQRHRVLTESHDPAWKKIRDAVVPELFNYPNRHGDVIHGLVFRPEGWKPEDSRPAIVYMYGGPLGRSHSVEVDTTHRLAYLFQLYMTWKHGYVTVVVDPRGQSGYGRRFQEANWKDPGKAQTEDLEDLVTLMGKDWGVDQKHIGLHGWSFGGFQTLYTLFHSPETFACGIATASPTQWENYNSWYSASTIDASERGKPTLSRHSLIPWARYLRRPLLLVHGMLDDNVLYQDTVNVYRALLESGKETLVDLFLDPDGDHGLGGAVKNWTVFRKYESWFLRNLGTHKP